MAASWAISPAPVSYTHLDVYKRQGEDQRFLLPAAALCGALLLSAASVLSKSVLPGQTLPIGIVTSLVGVPLFFTLILRRRRP